MPRKCHPLLLISLLALAALRLEAAEEIVPPFGLSWGTTEEKLAPMLKNAKAVVAQKHIANGREIWTVEGLKQANLVRTIFYFRLNELVEIEMQYQNAGWMEEDYQTFMRLLKEQLESRYGEGRLIARSKTPKDDVMQTITGYEWVQPGNAIQLIYFSAENRSQFYRIVSLHYKSM